MNDSPLVRSMAALLHRVLQNRLVLVFWDNEHPGGYLHPLEDRHPVSAIFSSLARSCVIFRFCFRVRSAVLTESWSQ